MAILNLTQHHATDEQSVAGVFQLTGEAREKLVALLTFHELPSKEEVRARAKAIANLAVQEAGWVSEAMIGGAPFLMAPLERELENRNIEVRYAFSLRESVEHLNEQGEVVKTSSFRHKGFVPSCG